jgi:MOSC domain-containing protein
MAASVSWLTIAPVKGLALSTREEIELTESGAVGDRRFHLVDAAGRLANGKRFGTLVRFDPELDEIAGSLALRGPNGVEVSGPVELTESVTTSFYGRPVAGHVVGGPFADVLSEAAGTALRLVAVDRPGDGVDRGGAGAATLLGTGSLRRLAGEASVAAVDPRRFRMLIGVDGIAPHEEDGWIGSRVAVGEAVVEPTGNVGRCLVTTQNPATGVADLPTLAVLTAYRGVMETTEPLPFGISARVVVAGRVAVGDPVTVE